MLRTHPFSSTPTRRPAAVDWGRWLSLALALVVVSWLALTAVPSVQAAPPELMAQSIQDLQNKQKTLDQQRNQLQQQQTELQNRQATSESNLEGLENSIVYTANQISETEFRLSQAEQELKDFEAKLAKAEADYENVRTGTVARLQYLQRQQGSEGWAVLLQSQNFNEFLDRQYQLKRVYASDRQVLADLKAQADAIQKQKAAVEEKRNQVALLRQQLLSQKQQYEAEASEEKQLISRLQDRRGALEAAESQLARESEQIGGLIRQKIAASTGVIRGTGRFVFPANANISSGFGNRVHPILGYSRFHGGVDFAASYGSAIRAADSGRVIFSGWYGGYGQAVIIDHGGGLSTLYAHASRLLVSEGQAVQQGQPIAAVGSTGLSTGPHLHFEVRQNGNPVNPAGYL
ncbi:peptidoglycan DD-metalloendopeptidase family protein [Leptolyngbya sp. CCNP1308]|uniref:murein hydrolase activator EnvC family protein n=1 Tax=Leptolyngbya sp. CCNP1308 TaxID=3110255 RepID=UPI002B1F70A4|nr:peptidoglycan DD-metalloendopeptidase family protein [Leptolyngbya sp. CCNP1308]MEA5449972.1 peptidoglycan DD-metalloendopeptidase family protein [Leptolyngbya sp. CCNP1308]